MELRHKSNDELFSLYDAELVLRIRNERNLEHERRLLSKFHEYLNSYPPSPELAKGFLSLYSNRKPRTLARYAATIKSFVKWYGEPMNDFRVKIPKTLPPYTKDSEVERLLSAIGNKRSQNKKSERNRATSPSSQFADSLKKGELYADCLNHLAQTATPAVIKDREGSNRQPNNTDTIPESVERCKTPLARA